MPTMPTVRRLAALPPLPSTTPAGPNPPAGPSTEPDGSAPRLLVLPATTHAYLARSAASLREALLTPDVARRYATAHVAALQAAAAVLAVRTHPDPRRRPQRNAWVLLTQVAPELGEWATFFSAGAAKRAAAEAGARGAVSEREADDLARDADRFLAVVETVLGLVPHAADETRAAGRAPSPARPSA